MTYFNDGHQGNTDEIKNKNDELSQRNEQLHADVVELKEDKEALEERAKSQLVFIIVKDDK